MKVQFLIPINEQKTSFGPKAEKYQFHHGDLEVNATVIAGSEPDITYDSIKWNGVDVLPLLDNISGGDDMLQHIYAATLDHAHYQLENHG